ncbi:MAG TPA: glycosyltransferase family 9 protein [Verrucomicrobiae bacterium]|nr:glycosyltransferase family 9 protein [Verrucomicrobiae bacterium]
MFGVKAASLVTENFSRILLVKPSAVGDVVHTIPLLVKLRARYPQARIDWFITPENADLVRHHPALSGVVLFNRRSFASFGRNWRATTGPFELLRQLRRTRYDLVIDMHGQFRTAAFVRASGAPVRIGFDRPIKRLPTETVHHELHNVPLHGWAGAREGSWLAYTHRIPIPTLDVHAIDRYLWVGKMLGLDSEPPDLRIYLSPEMEGRVAQLLVRHGLKEFAVLAPGTMWETKHWLPERFAETGRLLTQRGLGIVVVGTSRDKDRCRIVTDLCPGAVDLSGQTSVGELAAIIKRSKVAVTNDSGSMHLAVAMETPVVSIFGPTNPVHIGPYGQPGAVVRLDLPCSPCNYRRLSQCPFGHKCMEQLTAAMVLDRIDSLPPISLEASRR